MRCEWCGQESDRLEQIRHWEEHGSFGPPFYSVCPKCAAKEREGFEAASAEWAAYMEPRYTAQPARPADGSIVHEQRYAAPVARPEEGGEEGASPSSGV
jgi:hypothetical protein